MSKTIDERVVEMRFDNKQFESNVQTSMSTLDKLKQSLKFTGATKGLEEVSAATKKVDMTGLGSAVDSVHAKFSALQVMGVTALANITNSAVNAGKRMVSALTLEPVMSGFQEYETQMNAIQTIMANTQSKGSTLEDVKNALNELNEYADLTIYNFTEMTRNIGTFTAAGVGLEESVSAIKGIANLAAVSGSNAQQASTAMYQLSQALAAGRVSLMDWNSVVNAGMGGEVFQTALIRTARVMGTGVDAAIEKYGTFRESLTKGQWLTAEVLTETLSQISGAYTEADLLAKGYTQEQAKAIVELADTAVGAATDVKTFTQLWDTVQEAVGSGWAQTWQLIIGDFEEAKVFFSEMYAMIEPIISYFSDSRNNLLKGALGSNWDNLISQVNEAGIETSKFTEELEKSARAAVKNYDEIIEKNGSMAQAFMSGDLSASLVIDTLKRMAGATGEAGKATDDMAGKLEYFQKVVNDVWRGDYKNGQERVEALTAAGYDYAQVQSLVNKTVDGHKLTLEDLTDVQLKSVGYTEEEITALRELAKQAEETGTPLNELINNLTKPSGRELLLDSVKNLFSTIINTGKAVGKAWQEIFPPMQSSTIYNLIEGFHSLTKSMAENTETFDNITRTFKGLFAILDIITTVVGGGFKIAWEVLTTILGAFDMSVLDLTALLGDAAIALRNFLLGGEEVAEGMATAITSVKAWIDTFMELPVVQKIIKAFTNGLASLKDVGLDAIQGLQNGLASGLQSVPQILMDIGEKILEAICNVLGIKSPSKEMFAIGEFTIEGLLNGLSEGAIKIYDFIKSIASTIVDVASDILGNIDWGKIFAVGIGVGLLYVTLKMASAISALASPLEGLGDIFESVSKVINAKAWEIKANAIKSIAQALAILAGSVVALALVPWQKLLVGVGALAALAVILGGLSIAIGAWGPDDAIEFVGFAVAVLAIAGALAIVSSAIKKLQEIDPASATTTIGVFVAVVTSLMGVVSLFAIISKAGLDKNVTQFGALMIKLSVSLALAVGVMKLVSILNSSDVVKGSIALVGLLGFVAILAAIGMIPSKGIDQFGSTMLKLTISLGLMVGVIKLVSMLDWSEMGKGAVAILGFLQFVTILSVIGLLPGKGIDGLGKTMLSLSASMLLMVAVIKLVAGIELGDLIKGGLAISGFSVLLAQLALVSRLGGKNAPKLASTMLAMSVSVGILAGVAVLLSLIDLGGLAKGIVAVGMLSSFMVLMIAATKKTRNVMGNLIVMTVAIGIMATAVAALSFIDTGKLLGATASLSILMGMFAVIEKSGKDVKGSMATLIVMTLAVGALAGIIYLLQDVSAESALGTAASLSLLMLSLSAAMKILGKVGKISTQTTVALGVLTVAVAGVAAILGVLDYLNVEPSIETAAALSTLLLAMSAVCLILGPIGKTGPIAIKGAFILDAVIAVLGLLVYAVGGLVTGFPHIQTFVEKGIPLLEAMGKGIGSFFGGIIGGVMSGITSSLPAVAANLSGFMTGLTPFIDGAKTIDGATVGGIKSIAEIILMLTAADIINGIASFLGLGGTTTLSSFAEQLIPFGDAMAQFGQTIKGKVDPESTNAAANAGHMLAELNKSLPREGGWLQDFLGTNMDLTTFSEHMVAFGEAIVAFSQTIAPNGTSLVNEAAVEAAVNAGTMVAELNKNLPKSGGVVQAWFGTNMDLSAFSKDMVAFGEAIVAFSETVAPGGTIKVNQGAVEAAVNAGTVISDLNKNLPKSGGVVQAWFGTNMDLSTFSEQMKMFGSAIVAFSETIAPNGTSVINTEAVEASGNAAMVLAKLANNLPKQFGLAQVFTGYSSMALFGEDLEAFGNSLSAYAVSIADITPETVKDSADAAAALVELANGLPEDKLFTNETTLEDFGAQLKKFGEKFAEFYEEIKTINVYTLTNAVSGMETLMALAKDASGTDFDSFGNFGKSLEKIGKSGIDGFIKSFTDSYSRVTAAASGTFDALIGGINAKRNEVTTSINTVIDSLITAIDKQLSKFRTAGLNMADRIKTGFTFGSVSLTRTLTSSVSGWVTAIRNHYSKFRDAGIYLVEGFANGIRYNTSLASNAARQMAQAAADAARDELEIRSPSQVFNEIGDFSVEGFVGGLSGGFGEVATTGSDLGSTLLTSVSDFLGIESGSSTTFEEEVGDPVVDGIAEGITSNTSAEEAAEKKAQSIADAFQKEFDKIDLSESLLDLEHSLWESTNSTASDAVKDQKQIELLYTQYDLQNRRLTLSQNKYQQMIDEFGKTSDKAMEAYKEVLQAQIDLSDIVSQINDVKQSQIDREKDIFEQKASNLELEYSLWEKQNEQTATEGQKALQNISLLSQKYNLQLQRVQDAQESYNQMMKDFGTDALQTYEAYSELLNQQIELADLANQIAEARQEEMERNTAAFEEYEEYLRKNERKLERKGYSTEEIQQMAMKETGYDPNSLMESMEEDVKNATVSAMGTVQTAYASSADATFQPLVTSFSGYGATYATAIGTGIQNGSEPVAQTAANMVLGCATAMKNQRSSWTEAASYLIDGFIAGINNNVRRAADAAAAMAKRAYDAAMAELEVNSPSKKFAELGRFVDLGFAKGMRDHADEAAQASADMAQGAFSGLSAIISSLVDAINGDLDMQPTIRPVLDLSSVQAGSARLNTLVSRNQALTVQSHLDQTVTANGQNGAGAPSNAAGFQFVQNNYSPKALSRIEIYRQTKNQFSTFERMVKA